MNMTVTIVSLLLVQALLVPSGAAGTAKFICTIGRGNADTPECDSTASGMAEFTVHIMRTSITLSVFML